MGSSTPAQGPRQRDEQADQGGEDDPVGPAGRGVLLRQVLLAVGAADGVVEDPLPAVGARRRRPRGVHPPAVRAGPDGPGRPSAARAGGAGAGTPGCPCGRVGPAPGGGGWRAGSSPGASSSASPSPRKST